MKLSEKIYYCRKKAGLSQDALAEKLEVSRQAVSKWENGEAVPETGKLPGMAKVFGVTIDWLLSDEEPVQEEVRNVPLDDSDGIPGGGTSAGTREEFPGSEDAHTENASERSAQNSGSGKDLLGLFGRLVRMWGWLAGVYVAIGGAGITGIGMLAKYMVRKMISMNTMADPFGGGFGEIVITDASGNPMNSELAEVFREEFGSSMGYGTFGGMEPFGQELLTNNPVSVLANVMIAVGLVLMIGGIVLAVWLYNRREEK